MDLRLSAEQERTRAAVAEAAGRLAGERGEVDAAAALGELARLGALGWTTGGTADGQLLAVLACEELGRRLARGLYVDTLAGAELLARAGDTALLGRVTAGDEPLALALPLGLRLDGAAQAPLLQAGPRLRGEARFVACAPEASRLVVGARDAAGAAVLLLVPARRAGVTHARHDEVSRGQLYRVAFDAALGEDDVLLRDEAAVAALDAVRWAARLRQAAYLTGMAAAALDVTMEYVRQRQAFGRRLASFQALAFRISAAHTRVEAARLLTRTIACRAEREDVRLLAAQALTVATATAADAVAESVQMHGAHGITDAAVVQRHYLHTSVERVRLGRPADLLDEAAAMLAERGRTPVLEARTAP
jgi:alkylation response protein AidB-like acyl-CoA dehydrogenase